jgi:apoptosis-inducing factor 3
MHEEKGVKFILNSSPEEFLTGDDGNLTGVVVNSETVDADVCVVGIGVEASTGFLVSAIAYFLLEEKSSIALSCSGEH